ncbi:unnamed protein product [Cyprideis torosa]|uniref:Peptidase S1 domain-containing protein n=1 Tax=Cyprideis torosa TaxID=163714 RepID=A0A7R8WGK0_9CRUS|nr:unnamed protein product [Cyprideis torosa]CAG0898248.1 unnamed protein product [Cyprideis torosa]
MVFHDYGVIILKKVIGFEPGKVEPICLFLGDVRWVSAKTCEHEKIPFVCLPSYICFNKDAKGGICGGDSGGPVIGHEQSLGAWVQIGINGFLLGKPPFPECGSKDSTSFSATFFHFKEPELNAKTGNPWCDFFIRQIPHEVHLVKGNVHPNVFCQNPEKRFDWCEFPAPWVSAKACEWEEEVKRKRTHHCYRKARSCCPSHICIKENRGGICSGDSGGPVIGHESSLGAWVQIAINSFTSGPPGKGNLNCGNGDEMSFSGTFFYFKEPGPKSMTGNPWCDFFTKEIPNDVHLVKGSVHPNFFCQNPEKRFDWCEFAAPEVASPEFETWVITTNCPDTKCFPSHVCIKETYGGTCTGDSGGPILGHEKSLGAWVQVGITSYLKRKKKRIECSGDTVSFKGTFFHFIKPGLNSKIGNPWCDFFTKHIPYEAHLVKGRVHPSVFCEDPDKRFDWCDFPHP